MPDGYAAVDASDVPSVPYVAAVADAAADADVCAGTRAHTGTPASPEASAGQEAPTTPEFLPVVVCRGSYDYHIQKKRRKHTKEE